MKLLYVITKSNWGGAQRNVFDLCVAMKERGHDVAVAVGGNGILVKRLEDAGIYTHTIGDLGRDISPGKDTGSLKQIYSIIKHRRPDVLHVHSPKAAGLGAIAGRLLRVPKIVYTVHGWSFNEKRPWHERAVIALASWVTMLLCHQVVLISVRDFTQTHHFPGVKNKITLLPLGIKPPTFMSVDGAKQTLARAISMNNVDFNKRIVVGTIAELHPNKALPDLIDAMALVAHDHPHALCIIVGDGQDKAALHMRIKERNLEQHVFIAGFIDHAAEYLKAFAVFALPSIKEGLPYVLLEAGCASLPVVATTVGGIPDIAEDMKSGILIQPGDSRELAHALSFMIEHPIERKKYGAALRERVLQLFSFEKMVQMIDELYRIN